MSRRLGRRRRAATALAAVFAVVAGGLVLAGPGDAAPSRAAPSSAAPGGAAPAAPVATRAALHYARIAPLCATPAPGHEGCLALRRIPASKGTPGAVPYRTQVGATGPAGGFSPANLARVYGINPRTATTTTVAVIDAYNDPRVRQELNHFDRHYGLPAETASSFRVVDQRGGRALPKTDWGWAGEIVLDVQAVRGMCNTCKIVLVEADSSGTTDLATAVRTAVRLGAGVVSISYGAPESAMTPALAAAYRQPGVVIVAASGDDGWYDWDQVNSVDSTGAPGQSDDMPNAPASLPTVVAVGGTSLLLDPDGRRDIETVWNGNGLTNSGTYVGATGGGCSQQYAAPTWQRAVAGWGRTGCGGKRLATDVSAVADPATGFSVYGPDARDAKIDSWQVVGGTSLAAPLVAGMYAIAGGGGGVEYPAESLYVNYRNHPGWAYDVRYGGNGFCGGASTALCSLVVGQDAMFQTGNPNNLADGDGNWLGLLDCAYAVNGSEATVANDTQCNAVRGFDGPSGVGTVNGIGLLRPARSLVR